ncbi:MAG: antitoxin [Candidatus Omnitrophica bacterium]|nr:antitoxin [Candidatus Omnitrophota bacterium]
MKDTCKAAIEKWGANKQLNMVIEECAELIKAISKYQRYEHNGVWRLKAMEELADVSIMVEQGIMMLGTPAEFDRIRQEKIERLKTLIADRDDPERGLSHESH